MEKSTKETNQEAPQISLIVLGHLFTVFFKKDRSHFSQ